MKRRIFRCKHLDEFFYVFLIYVIYASPRAPAERLREKPDYNADDTHNENYARPNASFENIADQLAARQCKGQQEDYQEIDVSFHEKESFRLVMSI